jgi:CPA2 family monovalent cation:H+ antiporter-2
LLAGLAFGEGGLVPLVTAESFVSVGAEVGLILLLFMLGLEYTASELVSTLRANAFTGVIDLTLNFTPGFVGGLLLGFGTVTSIVLGGVTYVSSSGIVAKLLRDAKGASKQEARTILAVLVTEDLVMALYLPVVGVLLVGGSDLRSLIPAFFGVVAVIIVVLTATRVEVGISRVLFSRSDEALLLTILGVTVLVAGAAEFFGISAAVAALILGMVLAGPAAEGARGLLSPLRDLFAAIFFAFVGLSVDPSNIPAVLPAAVVLAISGIASKVATGWAAARRAGCDRAGAIRAGVTLIARGEFSIAIAGLATTAGVVPRFEALAVSYVLLLAVIGPVAVRITDHLAIAQPTLPASR